MPLIFPVLCAPAASIAKAAQSMAKSKLIAGAHMCELFVHQRRSRNVPK